MTVWPNGTKSKPYVTSAFGPRNINVPNASKNHKGTDMVGFKTIRAVEAGQVKIAGVRQGWTGLGNGVWVQHNGFFSKSGHSAQVLVRDGQFVREGDPLCVMGMSGTASDVHLHLEITPGTLHFSNTGQVDPVAFLSARIGGSLAGGGSSGLITPASPPPPPLEDDDMLMLNITGLGPTHKVALGNGVFRHFVGADPYEKIKNVSRIQDDWQEITATELPAFLRTFGCDLRIWDFRDGSFVVLDPLTGSVAPGNAWTAVAAARAAVSSIPQASVDPAPVVAAVKAAIAEGIDTTADEFADVLAKRLTRR